MFRLRPDGAWEFISGPPALVRHEDRDRVRELRSAWRGWNARMRAELKEEASKLKGDARRAGHERRVRRLLSTLNWVGGRVHVPHPDRDRVPRLESEAETILDLENSVARLDPPAYVAHGLLVERRIQTWPSRRTNDAVRRSEELVRQLESLQLRQSEAVMDMLERSVATRLRLRPGHVVTAEDDRWLLAKRTELATMFGPGNQGRRGRPGPGGRQPITRARAQEGAREPRTRRGRGRPRLDGEAAAQWVMTFPAVFDRHPELLELLKSRAIRVFAIDPRYMKRFRYGVDHAGKIGLFVKAARGYVSEDEPDGSDRMPTERDVVARLGVTLSVLDIAEKYARRLNVIPASVTLARESGRSITEEVRDYLQLGLSHVTVPGLEKEAAIKIFLLRHRRELA